MIDENELRSRGLRVADEVKDLRFIAYGKSDRPANAVDDYVPLLVRKRDAARTLRLLSIVEETTSDVGRVLDALLLQSELLAAQAQEIARLRIEIEQVRKEQVVTIVTNRMNNDLLAAAGQGVMIEDYECEVHTRSTYSEQQRTHTSEDGTGRKQGGGAITGEAEFGNLFDVIKGAKLHGANSSHALQKLEFASQSQTIESISHVEEAKAKLRVGRLSPPDKNA